MVANHETTPTLRNTLEQVGGADIPVCDPQVVPSPADAKLKSPVKSVPHYRQVHQRYAKRLDSLRDDPGKAHAFLKKHVLSNGNLGDDERAEFVMNALLGFHNVGRTNHGQVRSAFDGTNGREQAGRRGEPYWLTDAKNIRSNKGSLPFKPASREAQFARWREGENVAPGETLAAQVVFYSGKTKGSRPGMYVVPGIPLGSGVSLHKDKVSDHWDEAHPTRPVLVMPLEELHELKDEKKFQELHTRLRATMKSIDKKKLNQQIEADETTYLEQSTEKRLRDKKGREITVKKVAQNKEA